MTTTLSPDTTLLSALREHLRACTSTSDGIEQPHAILWTDPKRQWLTLVPDLLAEIPELVIHGEYQPDERTGPAIWIRCMIDRALETPALPEDRVPIVYLPGVGIQDLRAGEHCDEALCPLVELMYRGTVWRQRGGHDWSATAFLTSDDAMGLDISGDTATTDAVLRALSEFATAPVAQFQGRRLEADDFDKLLSSDVVRDLLLWMDDAERTKARLGADGWAAFCSRSVDEFEFNPDTDGEIAAGELLGCGEGKWAQVWDRFAEAPRHYQAIPGLLRRSKPALLTLDRSKWPDFNDEAEQRVRDAFAHMEELSPAESCDELLTLETEHALRRSWIWCRLGHSPMAQVLAPLAILAKHARTAIGGQSPDEIARTYIDRGWQADQASWQAVAMVHGEDRALVQHVVQLVLEPWLSDSANAFQGAVATNPLPNHGTAETVTAPENGCLFFADGLRYDVGESLRDHLESQGCRVTLNHRWSALPSVTATAKPAVTPIAGDISGSALPADFTPTITDTNKAANAANVRAALATIGYRTLAGGMDDWPKPNDDRGWAEDGQIDKRGHSLQADLATQLHSEVTALSERIIGMLDAGWEVVRVVTDHGWLLLPEGLPKVDLPKHLTASKWARCATIAGHSQVSVPTAAWHWNTAEHFATAPGVSCFTANNCYAHGGISIQECLIPDLLVERPRQADQRATIVSITWKGMRCFIHGEVGNTEIRADLRVVANGNSVAATAKPLDDDGTTSLLLADDQHESADLVVVLIASDGTVLAQHKTKVGIDS